MNSASTVTVKTSGPERKQPAKQQQVDLEELVGNTSDERNWRGIAIALLVILVVCALIITAIILVTPRTEDEHLGEKFSFDDFQDPKFKPHFFNPHWLLGQDKFIYRNEDGAVVEFDCNNNGSYSVIMDNATFRELNTVIYHISPDRQYVLLAHDIKQIYRHSKLARYKLYDVTTRTHRDMTGPMGMVFQYINWAPSGTALVFVQMNNLYYQSDIKSDPVQLTNNGVPEEIYNGIPDWVYEEEILGTDHAHWWTDDGNYLVYAVFNDSEVTKYYYPFYGDMRDPYGQQRAIAYPKPGTTNPTFQLKVVNFKKNTTKEIFPPDLFKNKEHYFSMVAWLDNEYFLVAWLNRAQNHSIITICGASSGACNQNQVIQDHSGWVDLFTPPLVAPGGRAYFWTLPLRDGQTGFWKHVSKITAPLSKSEGLRLDLTQGQFDVTSIAGYDGEKKLVYYISTGGDSRKRHLFKTASDASSEGFHEKKCLSCDLDEECQFYSASFSRSGKYYVLGCRGPGVPYFTLRSTTQGYMANLENNAVLREKVGEKALPKIEYHRIPLSDEEEEPAMWGKLLLPPELKETEILTYPTLLSVYGGPGSQKVTFEFKLDWDTYLASSHKIIIGYADGRGSGARGNNWLHQVYKKLGTVEVDDAIRAGEFYNKLTYVESSKIAIWGWSYGGFVTAAVLGRGKSVFKCGISVAPVTDWHYYDSVYTERYMGTPQDNLEGYKDSNISAYADSFTEAIFLLIHGTGDDNVHFQNSAQLMHALVQADVYFRSQIYTDQHHGLDGGNTKKHLYDTMEDFLQECYTGISRKFEQRTKKLQNNKQEPMNDEE